MFLSKFYQSLYYMFTDPEIFSDDEIEEKELETQPKRIKTLPSTNAPLGITRKITCKFSTEIVWTQVLY